MSVVASVGDMTVVAGASVHAVGMGYPGGYDGSPGVTVDPITGALISGSSGVNGGSHAGLGGLASVGSAVAPTYSACVLVANAVGTAQQCFTVAVSARASPGDAGLIPDAGAATPDAGAPSDDAGSPPDAGPGLSPAVPPRFLSSAGTTASCGIAYRERRKSRAPVR